MQNLINFHRFVHKTLRSNEIFTLTNGHNFVLYLRKLTRNNPNLDLDNSNANVKFGLIPLIRSHDIERKGDSDNNQGP